MSRKTLSGYIKAHLKKTTSSVCRSAGRQLRVRRSKKAGAVLSTRCKKSKLRRRSKYIKLQAKRLHAHMSS